MIFVFCCCDGTYLEAEAVVSGYQDVASAAQQPHRRFNGRNAGCRRSTDFASFRIINQHDVLRTSHKPTAMALFLDNTLPPRPWLNISPPFTSCRLAKF
jgi:hypothetical protein